MSKLQVYVGPYLYVEGWSSEELEKWEHVARDASPEGSDGMCLVSNVSGNAVAQFDSIESIVPGDYPMNVDNGPFDQTRKLSELFNEMVLHLVFVSSGVKSEYRWGVVVDYA